MEQRPVVLVVIKGLGLGGAERLISEAVPVWDHVRFEYRVAYFLPWKNQLVAEIEAQGVPVDLLSQGKTGLRAALSLKKHIAEVRADLVHCHSPAIAVLARLVSRAPVIYTEHNLADRYRQPTRLFNRLTYGRNARVVAVSDAVAASVANFRGELPLVVENGVSFVVSSTESAAARADLGIDIDRPLIVHVGNIRPYKGHRNLLAATRILAETHPNALVVSAGAEKSPGDLEKLQVEVSEAGLDSHIRFLGRREDARALLAAADVVVNPSDVEGLPVVVLEAMVLERPIVATSVGGVPDLIIDGDTGLLTDPGDPAALASAIGRMLDEPSWAAACGRSARAAAEQDYGLEPMVRSLEAVYEEVLRG